MYRPYSNSPLNNLPKGTLPLVRFASLVGVPISSVMKHIAPGVDGDRIEVTKVIWQCRMCRYVTPDQQNKAFEFWDKHRVRYRKPQESRITP